MTRSPRRPANATDNAAWKGARPALSVLVPTYRHDPTALLQALDEEAGHLHRSVELVLLDDGSGDTELDRRCREAVLGMRLPARFIALKRNEGRSRGRNRLAANARGGSLLFLDSDMLPDDRRFLKTWTDVIARADPAVAFGGFSLLQAPQEPHFAVHRALAARSECVPCDVRARQPEKYVYTSNLLIRRDVFEAERFDDAFSGWGWEDVEWAMRVARRFTVVHVDNPATHLGLESPDRLAAKYEQSVANFARVVGRHHDIVKAYPSYRAARLLKRTPGLRRWRPWLKRLALAERMPAGTRAFSLRLYRAALYAEAV